MCGWNIHSSLPERQNFSTLLVSFRREMNLLSPRTISFFPPKYQENAQSHSTSLSLYFLYFHGVETEVNGANSKVTGVALFCTGQRQRLLFSWERKGATVYWLSFHSPVFGCFAAFLRMLHSLLQRVWQSAALLIKALGLKSHYKGMFYVVAAVTQYPVKMINTFVLIQKERQGSVCVLPLSSKQKTSVCHMNMYVSLAAQYVFIC